MATQTHEKERIVLSVTEGTGDLLTKLAGGERKRGEYISKLVAVLSELNEKDPNLDSEALERGIEDNAKIAAQTFSLLGLNALLPSTSFIAGATIATIQYLLNKMDE